MSGAGVHFSLFRGGRSESANGAVPGRDAQELWFALARKRWYSLVLVPADEGRSVASIATALADVGGRLRDSPVTAIVAESMDYESARMLADLQLRVQVDRMDVDAVDVKAVIVAPSEATEDDRRPGAGNARPARLLPPAGQVVVAIQPIVVEPLGVAIAQAADAVVLCVELGRTRFKAARRTIELIGRERIAGTVLVGWP